MAWNVLPVCGHAASGARVLVLHVPQGSSTTNLSSSLSATASCWPSDYIGDGSYYKPVYSPVYMDWRTGVTLTASANPSYFTIPTRQGMAEVPVLTVLALRGGWRHGNWRVQPVTCCVCSCRVWLDPSMAGCTWPGSANYDQFAAIDNGMCNCSSNANQWDVDPYVVYPV